MSALSQEVQRELPGEQSSEGEQKRSVHYASPSAPGIHGLPFAQKFRCTTTTTHLSPAYASTFMLCILLPPCTLSTMRAASPHLFSLSDPSCPQSSSEIMRPSLPPIPRLREVSAPLCASNPQSRRSTLSNPEPYQTRHIRTMIKSPRSHLRIYGRCPSLCRATDCRNGE